MQYLEAAAVALCYVVATLFMVSLAMGIYIVYLIAKDDE